MPVLMMDVAKRAGVSITTVSHVVNETRDIAPDTRKRVLKAIKDLNYYKNSLARHLVRGQSDIVGLIISDIENPFLPPLVKSFDRACAAAGMELLLGMTNYEPRKAEAAVRRMIESRARGVAVMTSQIEERLIDTLVQAGVPVVALDLSRVGKGKSSLSIDYTTGILEAVEHLYVHGHRQIAVIHGPANIVSASRYARILSATILEYGMTLLDSIEAGNGAEDGAREATLLLSKKRRPTAILCGNDLVAIGAMGAAAGLGISVPGELSIIGSDDIAMASYSDPSLSTVRIPRDAMGHEAFRLLEAMYGPQLRRGANACIATSFIARGSSGQLAKRGRAKVTQMQQDAGRWGRIT
jgi:DNA-binding LacI/PurR family transcriptional regulator